MNVSSLQAIGLFLGRRVMYSAIVLLGVLVVTFGIVQLVPGDPIRLALGTRYTQESYDALLAASGLDRPLGAQFLSYVGNALTGDLGVSFRSGQPVTVLLLDRLPATISLALVGVLIALIIALPAGIWAGLREGRVADAIVRVSSQFGVSVPDFWMALLLISLFSATLGWLPPSGYAAFSEDPGEWVRRVILPAVTVGLVAAAIITRYVRAAVLDVAHSGFVRTAKSKACHRGRSRYAISCATPLFPSSRWLVFQLATILSGVIVVEVVFAWPASGGSYLKR